MTDAASVEQMKHNLECINRTYKQKYRYYKPIVYLF